MKSSSGAHYIGLDHIRAIATLMVFVWHFTHGPEGIPVPFGAAPWLAPFDEGHTGVALFMVLSGYLFAKLLNGRPVNYGAFFWNRILRLAPLLVVIFIINAGLSVRYGPPLSSYLGSLLAGLVLPNWPNGAWSITVEMHFYLALPVILYFSKRWPAAPLIGVAGAILFRSILLEVHGDIQDAAYWTIVGRADDFLMGVAAFSYRDYLRGRHILAVAIAVCFWAFFAWFDYIGGFYHTGTGNPVWIFLPTIEATAYSILIAYYDTTFSPRTTGLSRLWSKVGEYSYSIYLLHFFLVFRMAAFINRHVMDISNFSVALIWALVCFGLMVPIGYISYNYFEKRFLLLRKDYLRPSEAVETRRQLGIT